MESKSLAVLVCACLALFAAPVTALVPPMPLAAAASSSTLLLPSAVAALATTTSWIATETDLEIAELPPPYVPALFGVALLVGVGVLTGSLGNVMDEEASLGLQSGARAKKEIERSRSSYVKKR